MLFSLNQEAPTSTTLSIGRSSSQENVLHTKSKEDKLEKMKEIHYKTGKKIIFVEDMATNIQLMEENTDFIQGFHISSLLS